MGHIKLSDIDLLDVGNTIRLAGAIYRGNGKVFLAFLPDERGKMHPSPQDDDDVFFYPGQVPMDVLDMDRDDWTKFLRQSDILEIKAFQEQPDGKIAKAIVRKSQRQISQVISWEIFKRDGYKCRYCGKDDIPLTVDHLVLWEDCGPSIPENLVSSCRKCNKTRGNTQYAEWLKSDYLKAVSEGRQDNPGIGLIAIRELHELATTLDAIPRMPHKPSKR